MLGDFTREEIVETVRNSSSLREALIKLKASPAGANYKTLRKILDGESKTRKEGARHDHAKKPLKELMVKASTFSGHSLKRRIIKENLIPYKCALCEMDQWRGVKLVLILDHINGDNRDHRLENLRFLCPNCGSQQSTFAGRNRSRYEYKFNPRPLTEKRRCDKCGVSIMRGSLSGLCRSCLHKEQRAFKERKWKELSALLDAGHSFSYIAGKFAVSVKRITAVCRSLGLRRKEKIDLKSLRKGLKRGETFSSIAKNLGIRDSSVSYYAKTWGFKASPCVQKVFPEEVARLLKEGLTQKEIGERLRASHTSVTRVIRIHGLKTKG